MTPMILVTALPLLAFFSFIWASLQTEEVITSGYKQQGSDLWVETKTRTRKLKYPNIDEPVIPSEK